MTTALALALGAFLVIVGVSHFVVPGYYVRLVPPWVPRPRAAVLASGACEVVVGAALWVEGTRGPAAWAATALIAVYVLSHLDALVRASKARERWLDRPAGALARVAVNLGYLGWAAAVAMTA